MSYQIYYKWKVFKSDNIFNPEFFVFTLDGSNNCTMVNKYNGYQMRERDWHLFFKGNYPEFVAYLEKLYLNDEYAINGKRKDEIYNKIMRMALKKCDVIANLKTFFSVAKLYKYRADKGEERELNIEDLNDFKAENYFSTNSNKEYLLLEDETILKLRGRGY